MKQININASPRQVRQWRISRENKPSTQEEGSAKETGCTCMKNVKLQHNRFSISTFLLLVITLLTGTAVHAQTSQQKSVLYKHISPATDHYETLSTANATVRGGELETIVFPAKDFKRGAYLKMRTIYLDLPLDAFKVKPYPANSSVQTRAELNFLLELQQKRTPTDVARTDTMAAVYYDPYTVNLNDPDYSRNVKSLFYVGRNLGPWFNPEQLPVTNRVLQQVIQDATFYFFSLKASYNRARPYQLEPRLQNLEAPGHASYPSGHASASYVHAYLLSHLLPEYREQFLSNAYDMGFSREIRGVHYPSDSEAGRDFAEKFVERLMKSTKFKADFAAMKAEVALAKRNDKLTVRQ